jgi:hypothetical protein
LCADKYADLPVVPGAGLPIGVNPPAHTTRTNFARRSTSYKDPTGVWSG